MLLPVIMGIGFGYALSHNSSPGPALHGVQIRGVSPTLGHLSIPEAEAFLQGGLIGLDLYQLSQGTPGISKALHDGRVRYNRLDRREHWMSLREIWSRGFGDCEDLACAVAAERTFNGLPSRLVIYRVRPGLAHAVVEDLRTGRLLDPSRTGGM